MRFHLILFARFASGEFYQRREDGGFKLCMPDRRCFVLSGVPLSSMPRTAGRTPSYDQAIECGWRPNCIAGVKGERGCHEIEFHKFRRTCIATWIRNRIDPRTVMKYAGHADLETTRRAGCLDRDLTPTADNRHGGDDL
jgi:hypothetical protein